jgi:hypothetical protein
MLRALANGRTFVMPFSALIPGTVIVLWKVGPGNGRVVAAAVRRYDRPSRGSRAQIRLVPAPGARRFIDWLGSRLGLVVRAGFAEYRPVHGEPGSEEHSTALESPVQEAGARGRAPTAHS